MVKLFRIQWILINLIWKILYIYTRVILKRFTWIIRLYWPSTELSIKRCTSVNNRCIRSKTSGYHFDLWTGWIGCNCDAHRKQVNVKQLYNPVPQTVWISWSQLQVEFESQFEAVRTSSRQRAWVLRTPVEQPSRKRKKCGYGKRKLGQYVAVCFISNSPLTQPFRNPFEN